MVIHPSGGTVFDALALPIFDGLGGFSAGQLTAQIQSGQSSCHYRDTSESVLQVSQTPYHHPIRPLPRLLLQVESSQHNHADLLHYRPRHDSDHRWRSRYGDVIHSTSCSPCSTTGDWCSACDSASNGRCCSEQSRSFSNFILHFVYVSNSIRTW